MDEETKSLLERVEKIIADAMQPNVVERWELRGDQIVSISVSGPPWHPDCLFVGIASVYNTDEEYGKARGRLLAESRQIVPALRDALLKLDAEREAERAVWTEYIASLKGCVECTECPCETCTERTNRAKSQMYGLGLPML